MRTSAPGKRDSSRARRAGAEAPRGARATGHAGERDHRREVRTPARPAGADVAPCPRAEARPSAADGAPFPIPSPASGGRGRAEARPSAAHFFISGFTLIELVVVLLILTIILSLVGVRLTRDRADVLRQEAERLAALLQNAQQEAILESRPYGFALTDDGYQFLQLDDRYRLVPASGDALLRARRLPPGIRLAPVAAETDRPAGADAGSDIILFEPSGAFPAFTFKLETDGIAWYVRGTGHGQILPTPSLAPAAG